ncbi:Rad28p [Sugiyamaella lignohabitans]|uniref:Rad28p n=1 Tax=Sugiyamaella lignohabitans TaxID=796027 RepID=A0A167ELL5_9ASCO|nr:Rad28p [Sugiyamaella lignohabitans]ANB14222.1 Rad28p [Sugiyamaella lignohabitans]
MLSGGADSSIRLWDLDVSGHEETDDIADDTSPKGRLYVHEEPSVKCVGTIPRKSGHKFGVSTVLWWPFDNGMFVTSSFDGTAKVWDSESFEEAYSFNLETRIYSVDMSMVGDHCLVATAADHPLIRLLDLRTTSSTHTLTAHNGSVISVKWSPTDANILASGGSDGTVRLWDIRRSNACVCSLDMQQVNQTPNNTAVQYRRAHRSAVNGLIWTHDGGYLVSTGNDEKLRVWSLHEPGGRNLLVNFGPLVRNRHIQTVIPSLSSDGDLKTPYLFFPSDNGEIYMYRLEDGKMMKRLNRGSHATLPRTACITARNRGSLEFYSGAFDGTISAWCSHISGKKGPEESHDFEAFEDIWDNVGFR